jgi:hypothetical protein
MELEETGYENVKWNEMAKDHYPVTDFDISSKEYFEFYYEVSLYCVILSVISKM